MLTAQQPVDTARTNQLHRLAEDMKSQAEFDSAVAIYDQLISIYKAAGNWKQAAHYLNSKGYPLIQMGEHRASLETAQEGWEIASSRLDTPNIEQARACHYIGSAYNNMAVYDQAIIWLQRGVDIAQTHEPAYWLVGPFYLAMGNLYDSRGQYNKALRIYKDGVEHLKRVDNPRAASNIAFIYNNTGVAYRKQGKYKQALRYYKLTLDRYREIFGPEHSDVAMTYNNIGLVYQSMGDIGEALPYFKKALRIMKKVHGEEHHLVAALYNNISVIHRDQGDLELAIDFSRKAIDIKLKTLDAMHPELAVSYLNLAAIHRMRDRYGQSIEVLQKALDIQLENFDADHPELAATYTRIGRVRMLMGQYEQARSAYERGLQIARKRLPESHPYVAELYYRSGELAARQNQYKQALESYQLGLTGLLDNYQPRNVFDAPPLPEGYPVAILLDLFKGRASALKSRYLLTREQQELEAALSTYEQSVRLIDRMQQTYRSYESKFLLNRSTQNMYEQGLQAAQTLFKSTGDSTYLDRAFGFIEKSKARVLKELMAQQVAGRVANVPDTLVAYGRQLRQRLSFYRQQIAELQAAKDSDSSELTAFKDSLFALNSRLNDHITTLKKQYPRYFQLQYATGDITIDQVRSTLLGPDESMVQYFVGSENLYALVISSDSGTRLVNLPADSTLGDDINQLRQAINEEQPESFAPLAARLYRQLVEPVTEITDDHNLLIIPDGPLHYLPFETLLSETGNTATPFGWRDGRYLIQDYAVRYAPSASLLRLIKRHNKPGGEGLLALAPVFDDGDIRQTRSTRPYMQEELSPLPLSRYEVNTIAEIYQQATSLFGLFGGEESQVLLEKEATETRLRSLPLSKYKYIHFATHAYVDEKRPELSGILLSPQTGDEEDGQLHTGELYSLELNSDLVVLSACQTALGSRRTGDGLVGLVQPFFYAGSSALVVSLWNVADRATADLMIHFYSQVANGTPHSQALREAKLQLLDTPGQAAPRYWAPFIHLGR